MGVLIHKSDDQEEQENNNISISPIINLTLTPITNTNNNYDSFSIFRHKLVNCNIVQETKNINSQYTDNHIATSIQSFKFNIPILTYQIIYIVYQDVCSIDEDEFLDTVEILQNIFDETFCNLSITNRYNTINMDISLGTFNHNIDDISSGLIESYVFDKKITLHYDDENKSSFILDYINTEQPVYDFYDIQDKLIENNDNTLIVIMYTESNMDNE